MNPTAPRLLNEFQRGFPLVSRPYKAIADTCGLTEQAVLAELARLRHDGYISRIGATIAPGRVGASTLAALAVPSPDVARIAGIVSAIPEVNHNYQREHHFNLWFVVAAPDDEALERCLARIRHETACPMINAPLVREYRIDLGFDLAGHPEIRRRHASSLGERVHLARDEREVLAHLQNGLMLVPKPYATLAACAGTSETEVLAMLGRWCASGLIRRLGVIVRHRTLGYRANAMSVWDVGDDDVDHLGERLATAHGVTLAYRRRRQTPEWPFNLYCMVHGKARPAVEARLCEIGEAIGLQAYPHAVLFSARCFKQTGARYVMPQAEVANG